MKWIEWNEVCDEISAKKTKVYNKQSKNNVNNCHRVWHCQFPISSFFVDMAYSFGRSWRDRLLLRVTLGTGKWIPHNQTHSLVEASSMKTSQRPWEREVRTNSHLGANPANHQNWTAFSSYSYAPHWDIAARSLIGQVSGMNRYSTRDRYALYTLSHQPLPCYRTTRFASNESWSTPLSSAHYRDWQPKEWRLLKRYRPDTVHLD